MQIRDEPKLLDLMLQDLKSVPDIYQPTNYWSVYNEQIIPELYKQGLNDFRQRKQTMLHKFNAVDEPLSPIFDLRNIKVLNNRYTKKIGLLQHLLQLLNEMQISTQARQIRHSINKKAKKTGARTLDAFEASLAGNPDAVIRLAGKNYTSRILQNYLDYVYSSKFVDFNSLKLFVELGSGLGRQIEVLKKLHPDICFLVFEIPPQLYVCEQYLSAVFPDSVVSYKETRDMKQIPQDQEGKIFILGNWKFSIIESLAVDLFWNCASFQEMEPDVVANYLKYVNGSSKAVFLCQEMSGKKIAREKGERGVLKQTTLDDYKRGLPSLQLVDLSKKWQIKYSGNSQYGFWKRP